MESGQIQRNPVAASAAPWNRMETVVLYNKKHDCSTRKRQMPPHGTKDIFSQGACAKRHPTINTLCYDTVLAGEPRRRSEVGAALSQQGHDRKMSGRQG